MTTHHSRKGIAITLLACAGAIGIILLLYGADNQVNEKNLAYIRSYGWEVNDKPTEIIRLRIPEEFDPVFKTYQSAIQAGGFDLSAHKGTQATRYAYFVRNHEESESGLIRADVFVTKDGIIAADICSLEPGGFLRPIHDKTGQLSSLTSQYTISMKEIP